MKVLENITPKINQSQVGLDVDVAFWVLWEHVEAIFEEEVELVKWAIQLAQCVHNHPDDFNEYCRNTLY